MVKFRWALYQVVESERMFEIDVEGLDVETCMIGEKPIAQLIFSDGAIPAGVTLISTLAIGYERWKVQWSEGRRSQLLSALNGVFQRFVLLSHLYGKAWRERAAKERMERQATEVAENVWRARPQEQLGRRSVNDLWKLKSGAYEIAGRGFVWIGTPAGGGGPELEFHALFKNEKVNRDIRWYLERGTSLAEAISLYNRQQTMLATIAVAGFAVAIADNVGKMGDVAADAWEKIAQTMGMIFNQDNNPIPYVKDVPSYRHLFKDATRHFARWPVELRIQRLNKVHPAPIVKLPSKI